jgi:hypothetical protein
MEKTAYMKAIEDSPVWRRKLALIKEALTAAADAGVDIPEGAPQRMREAAAMRTIIEDDNVRRLFAAECYDKINGGA